MTGRDVSDLFVVGLDEVGRGAFAGPVTAACVVFEPPVSRFAGYGVTDSKLLSPEKREALSTWIKRSALYTGLGWASVEEVERLNIRNASLLAMLRAVRALPEEFLAQRSTLFVLDGKDSLPDFSYPQTAVVGGDRLVLSISAASILAKVARDRYMVDLDLQFPHFGFADHKGYGTERHRKAIRNHGLSSHHRIHFCRNVLGE